MFVFVDNAESRKEKSHQRRNKRKRRKKLTAESRGMRGRGRDWKRKLHLPGQLLVAPPADEHIVQQRNNRNEDLQTVTTSALELA
ncbi:hypothetical protein T4A_3230 [Trichinella pseudospiralis]|uniref:Uncharacterized protein n=1 Tax=Trichinella pseudospiralis TaxID=6337 RepID=A0A0V1DTZ4_TRIPS|nr:hypothetical protein T4A_3230 [Trichinella pseudospiralis]